MKLTFRFKGGEGSGFFGHAGRPGHVGGSMAADKGGGGLSTGGASTGGKKSVVPKSGKLYRFNVSSADAANMDKLIESGYTMARVRTPAGINAIGFYKRAKSGKLAYILYDNMGWGYVERLHAPSRTITSNFDSAFRSVEDMMDKPNTAATQTAILQSAVKAGASILNANSPYKGVAAGNRGQWSVHSDKVKFNASGSKLADFLRPHLDDMTFEDKSTASIFLEAYDEHGTNEFEIESHALQTYSRAADIAAAIAHGKDTTGQGYQAYDFMKFMDKRRDDENSKWLDRYARRGR